MTELTARGIGCDAEQVLVASTGVIGRPLPMQILEAGIPKALAALSRDGLDDFAHSILTTDTKTKVARRQTDSATILGIAKGAAMIGPNMATMLGFILTDARIDADRLQVILHECTQRTFNRIAVEGHTSTNDCVLAMASGRTDSPQDALAESIREVCANLARQIIDDAEGAKHTILIRVTGCRSDADAERIARTVASSALVKTAVFGADPNWGRVVSAAGYAGVPFEEQDLSLTMGPMLLYRDGTPLPFNASDASDYLRTNRAIEFHLAFALGQGQCEFLTSDLTDEYVKLNADYTT